jgi:hypothetical protein
MIASSPLGHGAGYLAQSHRPSKFAMEKAGVTAELGSRYAQYNTTRAEFVFVFPRRTNFIRLCLKHNCSCVSVSGSRQQQARQ